MNLNSLINEKIFPCPLAIKEKFLIDNETVHVLKIGVEIFEIESVKQAYFNELWIKVDLPNNQSFTLDVENINDFPEFNKLLKLGEEFNTFKINYEDFLLKSEEIANSFNVPIEFFENKSPHFKKDEKHIELMKIKILKEFHDCTIESNLAFYDFKISYKNNSFFIKIISEKSHTRFVEEHFLDISEKLNPNKKLEVVSKKDDYKGLYNWIKK